MYLDSQNLLLYDYLRAVRPLTCTHGSQIVGIAIVIPQILFGLSLALILLTSLEFTIAQSPLEMRGIMIGLWFTPYGLGYPINNSGKYSFKCESDVICQNLALWSF